MKIEYLVKASLGVFLEKVPVAGTLYKIFDDIDNQINLDRMEVLISNNSCYIKEVINKIDQLNKRIGNVEEVVREIRQYNKHNDLVLSPEIFSTNPKFFRILNDPTHEGLRIESVHKAKKIESAIPFIVYKNEHPLLYNVPLAMLDSLLKDRRTSLTNDNLITRDRTSESGWIIQDRSLFKNPSGIYLRANVDTRLFSMTIAGRHNVQRLVAAYLKNRFPNYRYEQYSGHTSVVFENYNYAKYNTINIIDDILNRTMKIRKNYNLNIMNDSFTECSLAHLALAISFVDIDYRNHVRATKEGKRTCLLYDLMDQLPTKDSIIRYLVLKFPHYDHKNDIRHYANSAFSWDLSIVSNISDLDNIVDKLYYKWNGQPSNYECSSPIDIMDNVFAYLNGAI